MDHGDLTGVAVDLEVFEDGSPARLVSRTDAGRDADDGDRGRLEEALRDVSARAGEPSSNTSRSTATPVRSP
ncbi:hypothetical protein BST36_13100 [Mycolicibacterium moriokaense]|nr:hypothetical protein BST36_13100 [Mycolicibacterium moriokaense]